MFYCILLCVCDYFIDLLLLLLLLFNKCMRYNLNLPILIVIEELNKNIELYFLYFEKLKIKTIKN